MDGVGMGGFDKHRKGCLGDVTTKIHMLFRRMSFVMKRQNENKVKKI